MRPFIEKYCADGGGEGLHLYTRERSGKAQVEKILATKLRS